jgi:hypothetical protein
MKVEWIMSGYVSAVYIGGCIKVEVWYSSMYQSFMFTGDLERTPTKLKVDTLEQARELALKLTKERLISLAKSI